MRLWVQVSLFVTNRKDKLIDGVAAVLMEPVFARATPPKFLLGVARIVDIVMQAVFAAHVAISL